MPLSVLDAAALDAVLPGLAGWSRCPDRPAIARSFLFKDFSEAFGFMARSALAAERLNHHPDWSNAWNRVEVVLSTHEAGGVTERDLRLAQAMNAIADATSLGVRQDQRAQNSPT